MNEPTRQQLTALRCFDREPGNDAKCIRAGLLRAIHAGRELDNGTARVLASLWHDGSPEALAFTSSGAIDPENTSVTWRACGGNDGSMHAGWKLAFDYFGTYLLNRKERGPIQGWSALWGNANVVACLCPHDDDTPDCQLPLAGDTCQGHDSNCPRRQLVEALV